MINSYTVKTFFSHLTNEKKRNAYKYFSNIEKYGIIISINNRLYYNV